MSHPYVTRSVQEKVSAATEKKIENLSCTERFFFLKIFPKKIGKMGMVSAAKKNDHRYDR